MSEEMVQIRRKPSLNSFGLIMGVGAGSGAWLVLDNVALGVAVGVALAIIFSAAWPTKTKHRTESQ